MRVLVLGVSLPAETFIEQLLKGLTQQGDLTIYLASNHKPLRKWLKIPRFKWVWIPKKIYWSKLYLSVLARFYKWQAIYFPWNIAAIRYLNLFQLNIPTVISCRGTYINITPHNPKNPEMIDGLRATFQKASKVHCVSKAILEEAKKYGLIEEKASVLSQGVDIDFFKPDNFMKQEKNKINIVTVGNLIWKKGHEYALVAIRQLVDRGLNIHFHIIGEGPERGRVIYTISDLNLTRHVTLHGRLLRVDVRKQLQLADIFMLSSVSEGIANVVLEAMACGLPIITSDCGGMREVVEDGKQGYVTPARDVLALTEATEKLVLDNKLRKAMGEQSRITVEKKFPLKQQLNQFQTMFHELV